MIISKVILKKYDVRSKALLWLSRVSTSELCEDANEPSGFLSVGISLTI